MRRRLLSLLLVVLMICAMVPVEALGVLADDDTGTQYTITYTYDAARGSVEGPASAVPGETVHFSVTPNTGYFALIYLVPSIDSDEEDETFVMPGEDVTVIVEFRQICTILAECSPAEGGTAEVTTEADDGLILEGDTVTASAAPADGWTFRYWTNLMGETVSSQAEYTFTAEGNETLTAHFTQLPAADCTVTLTAGEGFGSDVIYSTADGIGGQEPAGGGFWTADGLVIFKVPACPFEAPEGKRFRNWGDGTDPGDNIILEDGESRTLTAIWEDIPSERCLIRFESNGGGGTMQPVSVPRGTDYTLPDCPFRAPSNMKFSCWTVTAPHSGWSADRDPGDVINVTEDLVVGAWWEYTYSEGYVKVILNGFRADQCRVLINGNSGRTARVSAGNAVEIEICCPESCGADLVTIAPTTSHSYEGIDNVLRVSYVQGSAGSTVVVETFRTVKVSFDLNGGTAEDYVVEPIVEPVGETYPLYYFQDRLSYITPPRGRVFYGRFKITDVAGNVTEYSDEDVLQGGEYVLNSDITVTPLWDSGITVEFEDGTDLTNEDGNPLYYYRGDDLLPQYPVPIVRGIDGSEFTEGEDYDLHFTNLDGFGEAGATPIRAGRYSMSVLGLGEFSEFIAAGRLFEIREARKIPVFFCRNTSPDDREFTTVYGYEGGYIPRVPSHYTNGSYVIGGWYTDAACTEGNEFDLTQPLNVQDSSIQLFAKWVHEHPLTKTALKRATRSADGNTAYWTCEECGKYYCNDTGREEAEISLEDTVIPKIATFTLSATTYTYTGKAKKPRVTVKDSAGNVIDASNYTVTYSNNVNAGKKAAVKVVLRSERYYSSKTVYFTINKAANPLKVAGKTATVKYSRLKSKSQTLSVTKVIDFRKKLKDTKAYLKASGSKYITINKKTGKVTVKKGLKKGTYTVKVKVKAAGDANHKASAWKTVKFKVTVK